MYNATPAFQIVNFTEPTTEAVTLDEVKNFSRVDLDYASNNDNLETIRDSAVEKLEGALNLFFTARQAKIQFGGGACDLPYGPQPIDGAVISVVKNSETVPLATDKYTVHGLNFKTICIGEGDYLGANITSWFYPIWGGWPEPWTWTPGYRDFYTVTYHTGYGTSGNTLPKGLKHAILMLADYMIKEQGTTELTIPTAIMKIANRWSKNLVIQ